MDRGAWWVAVRRVAQNQIELKLLSMHTRAPTIKLKKNYALELTATHPFIQSVHQLVI